MSRWGLLISEYDVKLVTPTTIKSQPLADLLSICPEKISFEHVPRIENKHADALASFGSRVTIQNGQHDLEHRVAESSSREEKMSVEGKTNDWRMPIHEQLRTLNITKETREFCLLNWQMFKKSNNGLLMKCVGEEEGKEKAEQLHGATCGEEGPGLYRRLQR
ncbi:hypothetical protein Ahy_B05g074614 [Arachis hypogaea]|uniref:RNase H type-1 domain-containing protein n=1 Tax=Arachis hypogaea TaxID=3818 RepID=A0A444YZD8_ARAHY|nr:hypothetical protein Ahy_B05g074614 [Arachis hypogaea]